MDDTTMSTGDIDIAALEAAAAEPETPEGEEAGGTETPTGESTTTEPTTEGASDGEPEQAPFVLPVTVDGEVRELSAEEAAAMAVKGYQYDALQPVLDKLELLAAEDGDLLAAIDRMMEANEAVQRRAYAERVGDDSELVERLMEADRLKRQQAFAAKTAARNEAAKQQEQSVNQRLAGEFVELQGMFPAVESFEAVPEAVVRDAVTHKRSLTDAYLRYRHAEDAKIRAAQEAQQTAAKASAGSLAGGEDANQSPEIEAAVKGIWR